ncbi:MAG: glutathione S-transferase [Pyrobaculum sp.]
MSFEEFLHWAARQNPIFSAQIPHLLSSGSPPLSYIKDLQLLMAVEEDGDVLMLGFLDLRKRVAIEIESCEAVESATTAISEAEDVPWPGMATKYAFSIYPIQCGGGVARGFVTVKINITRDKAFLNWGKAAYAILKNHVEEYLQHLDEKFRVLDAVEVV